MGLLDDAIREHLDLKRRQGADPGAIAREEQEVLDPSFHAEPAAWNDGLDLPPRDTSDVPAGAAPDGAAPGENHAPGDAEVADSATVAQETAELDMRVVLDEDGHTAAASPPDGPVGSRPVRAATPEELPEGDSLVWEVPGGSEGEPAPEEVPGQERLSFE